MRDKIVGIMYRIYEIVTDLSMAKDRQSRPQGAEAKEIDNRERGEYHVPYSFSRLRSA
jgi:hypothetical protein